MMCKFSSIARGEMSFVVRRGSLMVGVRVRWLRAIKVSSPGVEVLLVT